MTKAEKSIELRPKVANGTQEIQELRKLSTEKLIIWIVGRGRELGRELNLEELVAAWDLISPRPVPPPTAFELGAGKRQSTHGSQPSRGTRKSVSTICSS